MENRADSQDILRRIRETERNADRIFREAETEGRSLREQARSRAAEMLNQKKAELVQRRESLLAQQLSEARQQSARIVEQAGEEARVLEGRAKSKIPDAVELLLTRLLPH